MWLIAFGIVALTLIIIIALSIYAFKLINRLKEQQQKIQFAVSAGSTRLKESIEIIARAMQNGECNHSEGVIRLTMLLLPFGKSLQPYQAMFALYQVVKEMPTHDERKNLPKNQRIKLDLTRENAELKFEKEIMTELRRFLTDLKILRKCNV